MADSESIRTSHALLVRSKPFCIPFKIKCMPHKIFSVNYKPIKMTPLYTWINWRKNEVRALVSINMYSMLHGHSYTNMGMTRRHC